MTDTCTTTDVRLTPVRTDMAPVADGSIFARQVACLHHELCAADARAEPAVSNA